MTVQSSIIVASLEGKIETDMFTINRTGGAGEMLQRGLAVLLSVCMLTGGNGDLVSAAIPQAVLVTDESGLIGDSDVITGIEGTGEGDITGETAGGAEATEDGTVNKDSVTGGVADGDGAAGEAASGEGITGAGNDSGAAGDDGGSGIGMAGGGSGDDNNEPDEENDSENTDGMVDDGEPAETDGERPEEESDREDNSEAVETDTLSQNCLSGREDSVDTVDETFMDHARKEEALTAVQDSAGDYMLQSDSYRLQLVLTPHYSKVRLEMKLLQAGADGVKDSIYKVRYTCSDGLNSTDKVMSLMSPKDYREETVIGSLSGVETFRITKLEIFDGSGSVLAMLGEDAQEIAVKMPVTDKPGVLAETTFTTKRFVTPISLTVSEKEIFLNKGMSRKLTVTVEPKEAAEGLVWTSSDQTVAVVDEDGTVKALKAGEADITVSAAEAEQETAGAAADGKETLSAACHVTVRDYGICVAKADGSYEELPEILSKTQKRTLVVYDHAAGARLREVTWESSNPHSARIAADGLLEPQSYGQAYITARAADGITLKTAVNVVNEIQGFSITRPKTEHRAYQAVRTAEAAYQVAAGETYQVGCVLSPAYTEQESISVSMAGGRFDWSADHDGITFQESEEDGDLMEITIPQAVSGQIRITAVMKDEEYRDKRFTITLDVLKKPEVETLPDTYTWLDYSNKLVSAGLPEHWQWKEQDTLLYGTGAKEFTARYTETGYYPYETGVTVHAQKMDAGLAVQGTGVDGDGALPDNYSAARKAYIVKKGTPLQVRLHTAAGSIPEQLYEQAAPAAKDVSKVSVSAPDAEGSYSVTAFAKGTYTISAAVSLRKAAFEKKDGAYVLTAGEKVKDASVSLKLMAVDAAPIQKISFAVADDSPEKVTISEDGTIEYGITAANADTKQNARVIYLDVTAVDADGSPVAAPKIDYTASDPSLLKLKKEGAGRLVLTIPKGADGLARMTAKAKDDLGQSARLAVRVQDYTPRVTAYKTTLYENCSNSSRLAEAVLPYMQDGSDRIEKVALVETAAKDGRDEAAGLRVQALPVSGSCKYRVELSVTDKEKIQKKGSLKYYLAITTKAYGCIFVPVQIRLESGMPAVTVKQPGKVNVFYTDTTHISGYDEVSMGLAEIASSAEIESVRWSAGDGSVTDGNAEFVIAKYGAPVQKDGKHMQKYTIRQHRPILDSKRKPSDAAVKGTLYIRLSGYGEEIAKPFTIQTVYRKPKLTVADYQVCPELGWPTDAKTIYTNAAQSYNYVVQRPGNVWNEYDRLICADEEIEIVNSTGEVQIRYTGKKNKKTKFTLYSDYWYEPLTVPVRVRVGKGKVRLSETSVTLNTAYPAETVQTSVRTAFQDVTTGRYALATDVRIEGADARSQQLLDKSLLNFHYKYLRVSMSVNYAKAMGSEQIRPGTYRYKLTPYYHEKKLNSLTLKVKIVDKPVTVKVRTKGAIDLLKLDGSGTGYGWYAGNAVTVTPAFRNVNSSSEVTDIELCGAYKDLFRVVNRRTDGTMEIIPRFVGRLKAGKGYTLSVKYTIQDYGDGGEAVKVMSNSFTVKPKQSLPKVTSSVKQLTLYACAEGKSETMELYVPYSMAGCCAIEDAGGSLDVDQDGRADLMVETTDISPYKECATVKVYLLNADAVRATAKGVAYKIPVTVKCVGRDGVSRDASTTVKVLVKK